MCSDNAVNDQSERYRWVVSTMDEAGGREPYPCTQMLSVANYDSTPYDIVNGLTVAVH